ncbi:hypothetical protein Vadar_010472 [Vaccinium darrowii]|uniref:Uncharacterized protein n=1 Tax=Vaccinium darrowii TaxID=229202 RepID=A0ACB7ZBM2_9ERIC|nr:hypothetical protein Vadar_010472 [Vaccinium darrowii]
MPFTHPYFDFIINHKGKVVTLCDIDPERYCYFDLMSHVSEGVLSDYSAGLGLSISIFCELRGSGYRVERDSDKALINTEAHDHLAKLTVSSWARHALDVRVRSDHITNNGTESFNNWLGPLRGKPILTMLEGIRCKVMSRIQTKYKKGVAWKDGSDGQ